MRIYLIIIATALAAGCATQSPPTPESPGVNLAGYSQAFRAGYADGCASIDSARKRDESRFKVDTDYGMGWRDGYDICRRRK
jgi:hypothetical protein